MNDAGVVCRFERLADLLRDLQRFFDWQWPLCNAIRERGPINKLQYQRLGVGGIFQTVDARYTSPIPPSPIFARTS